MGKEIVANRIYGICETVCWHRKTSRSGQSQPEPHANAIIVRRRMIWETLRLLGLISISAQQLTTDSTHRIMGECDWTLGGSARSSPVRRGVHVVTNPDERAFPSDGAF